MLSDTMKLILIMVAIVGIILLAFGGYFAYTIYKWIQNGPPGTVQPYSCGNSSSLGGTSYMTCSEAAQLLGVNGLYTSTWYNSTMPNFTRAIVFPGTIGASIGTSVSASFCPDFENMSNLALAGNVTRYWDTGDHPPSRRVVGMTEYVYQIPKSTYLSYLYGFYLRCGPLTVVNATQNGMLYTYNVIIEPNALYNDTTYKLDIPITTIHLIGQKHNELVWLYVYSDRQINTSLMVSTVAKDLP